MDRIRVSVRASDPIVRAGVLSYLSRRAELQVLPDYRSTDAQVLLVVVDVLTAEVMRSLREASRQSEVRARCVLVAGELRNANMLAIVECGVVAVVPRLAATPERIINTVLAASRGRGGFTPDVQGALFDQLEQLTQQGPSLGLGTSALTPREIDVFRLVSEGWDTAEIGTKLSYSERTVKNIVHGALTRLKLRNRCHAVTYALRAGLI